MREIKFRAFVKPFNKMVEVRSITFGPSIYCRNGYIEYTETDIPNPRGSITVPMDDVSLMEYTGLKDQNGKEIYEGDIYRSWGDTICNMAYNDLRLVKWKDDAPYLTNSYLDGNTAVSGCVFNKSNASKYFEIIGNIYENPELLENQ